MCTDSETPLKKGITQPCPPSLHLLFELQPVFHASPISPTKILSILSQHFTSFETLIHIIANLFDSHNQQYLINPFTHRITSFTAASTTLPCLLSIMAVIVDLAADINSQKTPLLPEMWVIILSYLKKPRPAPLSRPLRSELRQPDLCQAMLVCRVSSLRADESDHFEAC